MTNYVWIARDKVVIWNELNLFTGEPELRASGLFSSPERSIGLPPDQFPDIAPGECVRFKLIRDDEEGGEG